MHQTAGTDNCAPQALKEGVVFRGDSYISDDVVEERYGILWKDGFVTRRRAESSSNGKVWPLYRNCKLKPIEEKTLTVLRSSHTILSLAYGKYDSRKLFCFKVQWHSRGVLTKESLVLAFKDYETAAEWRQHFESAIRALQQQPETDDADSKQLKKLLKARQHGHRASQPSFPQDDSGASQEDWTSLDAAKGDEDGSSPNARVPLVVRGESGSDGRKIKATISADDLSSFMGADTPEEEHGEGMDSSIAMAATAANFAPSRFEKDGGSFLAKTAPDYLSAGLADHSFDDATIPKDWAPFRILNGLAVYKEEELAGQGGAYMLSGTMKSSPKTCFEALMDIRGGRSNIWAFTTITKVIRNPMDPHTIVFRALMSPQGSMGRVLKQREVVLRRSWRLEEDGSYIVVFHSIEHEEFPFRADVQRAHVDAMNFTIAPLKSPPSPHRAKPSEECLVTVVLKVDLGGLFSRASFWRYLLFFVETWERTWIETLLMTVVALRDKVEQDRFVAGPASLRASKPILPPVAATHGTAAPQQPPGTEARIGCLQPLQFMSPHSSADSPTSVSDSEPHSMCEKSNGFSESKSARTPAVWLDKRYWSCPGRAGFKVRGATYLTDRKKVPSEDPVFTLQGVELVKFPQTTYHVSRFLPAVRHSEVPFNFVLCFQLPFGGQVIGLALIFAADYVPNTRTLQDDASQDEHEVLDPFDLNMARFLASEDGTLRNAKLKLIPSLAVGSWIMRQAVGQTPVMLGKKLRTEYFKGDGYLEADIDISSNSTAASVTSMVAGAIKSLVFDIGILLEGHHSEELPERLLGSARLNNLDLKEARALDTSVELEQVPRKKLCFGPRHESAAPDGHELRLHPSHSVDASRADKEAHADAEDKHKIAARHKRSASCM